MEFRKMVTITLYTRQQKRHWCIEQAYGLCGRGRGWEDLGEWYWNMWNVMYETRCQSRFNAQCWMLGAGALGRPRGMVWGGRRVQDGEHMRNKGINFFLIKKKKKRRAELVVNQIKLRKLEKCRSLTPTAMVGPFLPSCRVYASRQCFPFLLGN